MRGGAKELSNNSTKKGKKRKSSNIDSSDHGAVITIDLTQEQA